LRGNLIIVSESSECSYSVSEYISDFLVVNNRWKSIHFILGSGRQLQLRGLLNRLLKLEDRGSIKLLMKCSRAVVGGDLIINPTRLGLKHIVLNGTVRVVRLLGDARLIGAVAN
jgi:hypothetical protein